MGPTASWAAYRTSIGDRSDLFTSLVESWPARRALYPGCYLDLSPSVAIPSVTYIDTDRRAARYFSDVAVARSEVATHGGRADVDIEFFACDYTRPLPVPAAGFDLLISLYAGPVWEHCGVHLKTGGMLLANASHGDASLAALDPDLQLVAAVLHRAGRYRLDDNQLDRYLVPKNPASADASQIRQAGRGIPYTRPAFAYLFKLADQ